MPSIAQINAFSAFSNSPPSLKKRKRAQWPFDDAEQYARLGGVQYTTALTDSHPITKTDNFNSAAPSLSAAFNMAFPNHQQRLVLKPRGMKPLRSPDLKRQRVVVSNAQQQDGDDGPSNFQFFTPPYASYSDKPPDPELATNLSLSDRTSKMNLSPCHICHQKPRVKKDLDAYGYCEECEKRTCYVCMRSCLGVYLEIVSNILSERCEKEASGISFANQGIPEAEEGDASGAEQNSTPAEREELGDMDLHRACPASKEKTRCHGHRERICSHCCVERGVDGEVWCLGCLQVEEEQLRSAPK